MEDKNENMIISLGYRIRSVIATHFRRSTCEFQEGGNIKLWRSVIL